MNGSGDLQQLARTNGIELHYDALGVRKRASVDSLRSILATLGIAAQTDAETRESLRISAESAWKRMVEPVTVLWLEHKPRLRLRVASSMARSEVECELRFEDGACKIWSFRPDQGRKLDEAKLGRFTYSQFETPLPVLPMGYHTVTLRTKAGLWRTMLIVSPSISHCDPELAGSWGVFLPVYAAHSKESWGAGNLTDYSHLSRWVRKQGGAFIGSVPILAGFMEDWCCEPSPYAPASRLFWNEFFIDITAVPEFAASAKARRQVRSRSFQKTLEGFRASPLINYPEEMRARRAVLSVLAAEFSKNASSRREAFEAFLRVRPDVKDYARFRAMSEQKGAPWQQWEPRMRDGDLPGVDEAIARYHMYAQWIAQEQGDRVTQDANGAQFYLDLPLGAHPHSYDVWREQEAFALDATVGAPPDQFFSKGQNWAFAPPHPVNIRQQWHHYFRRVLEFHMKHTGLLRIDHAMCLHRLFWIPRGGSPADGVYVRYPAEELCALLCLESHRYKAVIVAENLGTVPAEVNSMLSRHRFRGMHVLEFSLRHGKEPILPPEFCTLTSLDTHDTPTFAAFWRGDDITDRAELNLITREEALAQRQQRTELVQRIEQYLCRHGWLAKSQPSTLACIQACLRLLAASRAEMLSINLEDLWKEQSGQNTPGTTDQRPNWRRKSKYRIEEIFRMRNVKTLLAEITELRSGGIHGEENAGKK